MLSITNCYRQANQNHEIPPNTHKDGYFQRKHPKAKKKQNITGIGEDVEKSQPLSIAGWGASDAAGMDDSTGVPQNLNEEWPYDSAAPILSGSPLELKARASTGVCTPVFIASLFTRAKGRNHPEVHRQMAG